MVGGFPEHLVVEEVGEVGELHDHLVRLVHPSLVDWHQPTVNEVDDEFRREKTCLELK